MHAEPSGSPSLHITNGISYASTPIGRIEMLYIAFPYPWGEPTLGYVLISAQPVLFTPLSGEHL